MATSYKANSRFSEDRIEVGGFFGLVRNGTGVRISIPEEMSLRPLYEHEESTGLKFDGLRPPHSSEYSDQELKLLDVNAKPLLMHADGSNPTYPGARLVSDPCGSLTNSPVNYVAGYARTVSDSYGYLLQLVDILPFRPEHSQQLKEYIQERINSHEKRLSNLKQFKK